MDSEIAEREDVRELAEEKANKGWIKVWFAFEVMAVDKDVVEAAMKNHIKGLESIKEAIVYEKKFGSVEKVETPPKGIKEAYSQTAEVEAVIKDIFTLINIVMAYGPSAIEVMEPKEIKVSVEEAQNIANLIAGVVHQFASAGIGGMVIKIPEKKPVADE